MVLNNGEAALEAFGAQQKRVKKIPAFISNLVRILSSWGMKLEVCAYDVSTIPLVIPSLAHLAKDLVALGPDAPNAAPRSLCGCRIIPEHQKQERHLIE